MDDLAQMEVGVRDASRLGPVVAGSKMNIGNGFEALHFSHDRFEGRMDPLLMVDHFVMTGPTFPPHMHAGISAVTAMFEDSQGEFLNRDTLGNNISLHAGDLYWLVAASGAAHEEKPAPGARTHALQIFVDLPPHLKNAPARALLVPAQEVPVLEGDGYRARLLLGRSGTVSGADDTPEEMTMLDGYLEPLAQFTHPLPNGRQGWIYAVSGNLTLSQNGEMLTVSEGSAAAIAAGDETEIVIQATAQAHFVMFAAKPIRKPFTKASSLMMDTAKGTRSP
jgi:redox-sensitive bicupin YhaK (pirin superfamily)